MSRGAIGSRARLSYAAMLVGTGIISKEKLIALFPQGFKPNSSALYDKVDSSLGEMMERYLRSRPEMEGVLILSRALGWSTINNVPHVYKMVYDLGYDDAHIHFVSDPKHIKRVRLVWDKTHPQHWTASFHPARFHRMNWFERNIREPVARFVYRWRLRGRKQKKRQ